MKLLALLLLAMAAVSCGKRDSKDLEEKVQRELVVTNENTDKRAMALENDLARKQSFFSAVEGTFEGNLQVGDKVFKTRITFIPNLPPYTSGRVRTAEEVVADLNNLFFSVQTTHWNSKGTAVAAGCIFNQVRPDYSNGQISVSSDSCANVYKVSLFQTQEDGPETNQETIKILGRELATRVLSGDLRQINEVYLVVQPTLVAKTFFAKLARVNP